MPGFCEVFNCSNHADREKDKSIHGFSRQIMAKKTKNF